MTFDNNFNHLQGQQKSQKLNILFKDCTKIVLEASETVLKYSGQKTFKLLQKILKACNALRKDQKWLFPLISPAQIVSTDSGIFKIFRNIIIFEYISSNFSKSFLTFVGILLNILIIKITASDEGISISNLYFLKQ